MTRLQKIFSRYGKDTIFIVPAIALERFRQTIRNITLANWLRATTIGGIGTNIQFGRDLKFSAGANLVFGNNLYIGDRCIFDVSVNPKASLVVGENTWISHDCHLASLVKIHVGKNVLIGEFTSIRDSTHTYADALTPIKKQGDILGEIVIEDDVWIGRGALVLGRPTGIVIGQGAVIGANSVVSSSVPPMSVYAGAPARLVRMRELQAG